jgi:hypothetical protein
MIFAFLMKSFEELTSSSSISSLYFSIARKINLIAVSQSFSNPLDSSQSNPFFSENGQSSLDLTKFPNALYICDTAANPNLSADILSFDMIFFFY